MCGGERNLAAGWFLSLDHFTTYLVTTPPIPQSISTDSLTRRNNVLGFFMPHFTESQSERLHSIRPAASPLRPEAGSSRNAPCFRRKLPCTVWSTEPKVKWMVVGSGSSCKELCRSAAQMLTPASKTKAAVLTFHSGFILRLPFMTLCG